MHASVCADGRPLGRPSDILKRGSGGQGSKPQLIHRPCDTSGELQNELEAKAVCIMQCLQLMQW